MKVPTELPTHHGNKSTGLSYETSSIPAYVYFFKGLEGLSDENWSAEIYFFVGGGHGHAGLLCLHLFCSVGRCVVTRFESLKYGVVGRNA
jgi:hypothetical protein